VRKAIPNRRTKEFTKHSNKKRGHRYEKGTYERTEKNGESFVIG
jgi:uncharacterized C2H2 Zn-finger protein